MKTSSAPFSAGDRVRHSGHALREPRDRWLAAGRWDEKSRAKKHLDMLTALRGTVEACEPGKHTPWVVTVRTDTGAVHSSLPYIWEVAP